jgi:hypothetical protein
LKSRVSAEEGEPHITNINLTVVRQQRILQKHKESKLRTSNRYALMQFWKTKKCTKKREDVLSLYPNFRIEIMLLGNSWVTIFKKLSAIASNKKLVTVTMRFNGLSKGIKTNTSLVKLYSNMTAKKNFTSINKFRNNRKLHKNKSTYHFHLPWPSAQKML